MTFFYFYLETPNTDSVYSKFPKGNCWDNAPQENFVTHVMAEVAELLASCDTYEKPTVDVDD